MSRPILTREQMRAYDATAIERCGVPGAILMENAGRGAAEIIAREDTHGPVVVVCGAGNNGGDGFVVARHLLARDVYTEVVLLAEPERVQGDARLHLDALIGVGGRVTVVGDDDLDELEQSLETATLAVDALFGTGLSRDIAGRHAAAVVKLNEADCPCFALDIPSGIDADTGAIRGHAVMADTTITFAHLKAGLLQAAGVSHAGTVVRVGLGVPDDAIIGQVAVAASMIEPEAVRESVAARPVDTHKYRAGSVLAVAGSVGKLGAARLVARAILRTGAGIATIATWPDAVLGLGAMDEVMTSVIDAAAIDTTLAAALVKRKAVVIGPGLGMDAAARAVCDHIVLGWDGPVVVDADAITHFRGRGAALGDAAGARILTPHAGELGRVLGCTSAEVEAHRFDAARRAAALTGATVVLKGPRTVIATADRQHVCNEGNSALATAGSGDVLAGIIGALACRLEPHRAACAGVWLHARAAERWTARTGADRGMLASEIADGIPGALSDLLES